MRAGPMSRAALSESPECLRLEAAASPSARVAVSGARTAHLPPPHHRYKRDKYLGLAGSSRLTPVCLDPEYTTPGQINFGCKEAAKLFHNANTVFKAGTCDLATLEAEYGDEEEEQAKSLEELSPVTCADFCSSNPCCTLYKEDADDCILFGGSCVDSNRDSSEEADAAGMFLAIERTTTFEGAEEESAAFSDLVAVGNVIDAPQTPGTIFTVCEGEANSVDVQLTSTDAKDAMATLLLIGSKPQAADMEGRRLQATDTDEEFSFKGTKLNATEVVRLLTQLKEDIDIDSASTTLSPDQFEEVFASETARNTLLLAVFGLPPPPPCPNLTFPVKFASPSPSPPGVAYCPENEITNLSAPVLCGSYTSLTGGRDKTALRLKRVSSVPSADVCKAKCCKTVGCMSFTYAQGGKDEGRCDLYTVKVTEAAGFVPIPEDKDPRYVSASRNSVGPPSPPASPPSCQYFPEWAEGRANLRETGDADLIYCWQLTAERIDECDKFFYFTEHGVEGQIAKCVTKGPDVQGGSPVCNAKTNNKWSVVDRCPPVPPDSPPPPMPPTPYAPPPLPLLPGGLCHTELGKDGGAEWCYELVESALVGPCKNYFTTHNGKYRTCEAPAEGETTCSGGSVVLDAMPEPMCTAPVAAPEYCSTGPQWLTGRVNMRVDMEGMEFCYDANGYDCNQFYYANEEKYFKCVPSPENAAQCAAESDPTVWPEVCGAPLPVHQAPAGRRLSVIEVDALPLNLGLSLLASVAMFAAGFMMSRR